MMKNLKTLSFLCCAAAAMLFTSCDPATKGDTELPTLGLPVLTTTEPSGVANTTAISGGVISSDGGDSVTARGVCWATAANPTTADGKTSNGVGIGTFSSSISGLTAGTAYYVRAYATNANGTAYGSTYTITTTGTAGGGNVDTIQTALIPAGTFTLGSPTTEVNRNSDETQFSVTLSAFRMSKYEITNAQYAAFLNAKSIGGNGKYAAGVYPTQALIYSNSSWGLIYVGSQWVPVAGYESSPVVNVTWYGSTEYATYVGGTLPTEAQWEYACRAGTTTPFNTGDFLTNLQANYNWSYPYNGGTNTVTTYPGKTQPVGTYAPNAYGLCDMHGNVWEWCADWYGTYPTSAKPNPTGATTGSGRVIRGGCWNINARYCRSADRSYDSPDLNNNTIGFRVVFVP